MDDELRKKERASADDADVEAAARRLHSLVRAGELPLAHIQAAAALGDETARLLVQDDLAPPELFALLTPCRYEVLRRWVVDHVVALIESTAQDERLLQDHRERVRCARDVLCGPSADRMAYMQRAWRALGWAFPIEGPGFALQSALGLLFLHSISALANMPQDSYGTHPGTLFVDLLRACERVEGLLGAEPRARRALRDLLLSPEVA